MAQYLKRWESPRREGRNDKGRGGSARQRQRRKQIQALRKKLNTDSPPPSNSTQSRKLPSAASFFASSRHRLSGRSLSCLHSRAISIQTVGDTLD